MNPSKAIAAVLLLSGFLGGTVAYAGCAHRTPLSINGSTTKPGAPKWFEDPVPEAVAPGSSITVAGKLECVDTGNGRDPLVIAVLFVQGDKTVEIGRVTSDRLWKFETKVSLPGSAIAGAAVLRIEIVGFADPRPPQLNDRAQGPGSSRAAQVVPTLQQLEQQAPLLVTAPKG